MRPHTKHRLLGWWYLCIATGFVLLGFSRQLKGERPWLIALRYVVAAGFFALAYLELRTRKE
jgi:tetrahydromethanopterin S-methyltransferase subunit C